jgi:membrane dipeptidase
LTDLGRQLLAAMGELNMILDISHLAEAAAREAVESYQGLVIASHSNSKLYTPSDRGLPDKTIKKLVARDGVVGIMLYNRYLKPGWVEGNSRELVTLKTVADAIDTVAQLAGDTRHVAIGSDLDGGFGLNAIPLEMDSIAEMIGLADVLVQRGYSKEDIENIMNGNWLRILQKGLK